MKSFTKLFVSTLLGMVALLPVSANAVSTKMKMEIWNRWTMEQVDGETEKNEFAVKRAYLRLEPKLSDNIKGRFNLDFFSDDGMDDGAGIKLKYGYLEFKELIPVKDTKVYAGLIKNYFGTIYDWDYTTIEKDPSDKYKFSSSTDYGMAFYGYLPQGYGEYSLSLINGEGYKKTGSKLNTSMGMLANVRVTPIPGATIGASFLMNSKNEDEENDEGINEREDWKSIAVMGKYQSGPFMVMGEFLTQTTSYEIEGAEDVTKQAIMGMGTFALKDYTPVDADLVVRFDQYDNNTDADDDAETTIIGGANFNLQRDAKGKPVVMLQVNVENTTFEDNSDDELQVIAQLRWKFSNKLK